MGNNNQPQNDITLQSFQGWIKVQDQGNCQLWKNTKINRLCQAYPVSDLIVKNKKQLQIYAFRKAHRKNIVAVQAVITEDSEIVCTQPKASYVVTQNIDSRLSQYRQQLTFEQALYVLSQASSGYNTLNSFFGPVEPNSDMICINDEGQVKVWLNESLWLNEASLPMRQLNEDYTLAQKRTKQCVMSLFRLVEVATERGYPMSFKKDLQGISTYFEAINFLEYYGQTNRITMVDRITPLRIKGQSLYEHKQAHLNMLREQRRDILVPNQYIHINHQSNSNSRSNLTVQNQTYFPYKQHLIQSNTNLQSHHNIQSQGTIKSSTFFPSTQPKVIYQPPSQSILQPPVPRVSFQPQNNINLSLLPAHNPRSPQKRVLPPRSTLILQPSLKQLPLRSTLTFQPLQRNIVLQAQNTRPSIIQQAPRPRSVSAANSRQKSAGKQQIKAPSMMPPLPKGRPPAPINWNHKSNVKIVFKTNQGPTVPLATNNSSSAINLYKSQHVRIQKNKEESAQQLVKSNKSEVKVAQASYGQGRSAEIDRKVVGGGEYNNDSEEQAMQNMQQQLRNQQNQQQINHQLYIEDIQKRQDQIENKSFEPEKIQNRSSQCFQNNGFMVKNVVDNARLFQNSAQLHQSAQINSSHRQQQFNRIQAQINSIRRQQAQFKYNLKQSSQIKESLKQSSQIKESLKQSEQIQSGLKQSAQIKSGLLQSVDMQVQLPNTTQIPEDFKKTAQLQSNTRQAYQPQLNRQEFQQPIPVLKQTSQQLSIESGQYQQALVQAHNQLTYGHAQHQQTYGLAHRQLAYTSIHHQQTYAHPQKQHSSPNSMNGRQHQSSVHSYNQPEPQPLQSVSVSKRPFQQIQTRYIANNQQQIESVQQQQPEQQLFEWSNRLNQFTQSKVSASNNDSLSGLPHIQQPSQRKRLNQNEYQLKQPTKTHTQITNQNPISIQPQDDIQSYIRMKYQSYMNQTQNNSYPQYTSLNYSQTRIQNNKYSPRIQTKNNYQYYQKSYNSHQQQYNNYKSKQYDSYANSSKRLQDMFGDKYKSKQIQNICKNYDNYQVDSSARNQYHKNAARRKTRDSNLDQKYQKYVLNQPKKLKEKAMGMESQYLSELSQQSQNSISTDKFKSNFNHDKPSDRPRASKGVSYQHLRTLISDF